MRLRRPRAAENALSLCVSVESEIVLAEVSLGVCVMLGDKGAVWGVDDRKGQVRVS